MLCHKPVVGCFFICHRCAIVRDCFGGEEFIGHVADFQSALCDEFRVACHARRGDLCGEYDFHFDPVFDSEKDFTKLHFCQIPGTLVFSLCIDAAMYAFSSVAPEMYLWKMGILLVGTALVALGLALQGIADVLMLAGDGMVYAIVNRFHWEFGKVKTINDVILVSLAAILSYGDLGVIEGVREGTVISAIITGVIARFFLRVLGGWKDGRRVLRFYQ